MAKIFLLAVIIMGLINVSWALDLDSTQPTSTREEIKLDTQKCDHVKSDEDLPWYRSMNPTSMILIAFLSLMANFAIAKYVAFKQFKGTLNSKNRQEWINVIRDHTSEFLSQGLIIHMILSTRKVTDTNDEIAEKLKPHFEKMVYNKNKVVMLLNLEKPEQKDLLDKITITLNASTSAIADYDPTKFKEAEKQTLDSARHLFGVHWKKIKKL